MARSRDPAIAAEPSANRAESFQVFLFHLRVREGIELPFRGDYHGVVVHFVVRLLVRLQATADNPHLPAYAERHPFSAPNLWR